MRHQLNYLLTAIIIFAGLATSSVKADEIEGTWTQDGQYRKFSKEYKNATVLEVSADGKKFASISDSTLRIIDINTGMILNKYIIPYINDINNIPFTISKDFKYLAVMSNFNGSQGKYYVGVKIHNLYNNSIKLDTTIVFDFGISSGSVHLYSFSVQSIMSKFLNNDLFCTSLSVDYSLANTERGNKIFNYSYNCTNSNGSNSLPSIGLSNFYQDNSGNNIVTYSNSSSIYTPGSGGGYSIINYYESIYGLFKGISRTLSSRSWSINNQSTAPNARESEYRLLGITADGKKVVAFFENRIMLFDILGKEALRELREPNGNITFQDIFSAPQKLFSNADNGAVIVYFTKLRNNVICHQINYKTGIRNKFASINQDYITNTARLWMLDSTKVLLLSDEGVLRTIDLITTLPENRLDIISETTNCTTDDKLHFFALTPPGYRNIEIDFGDGTAVYSDDTYHRYYTPGIYSVQINAIDSNGNIHSTKRTNYISVSQGIDFRLKTNIEYFDNNKISITANVQFSKPKTSYNVRIYPNNQTDYYSEYISPPIYSRGFNSLGYYNVKVSLYDSLTKSYTSYDTLLAAFGPVIDRITYENYAGATLSPNAYYFRNSKGFQVFQTESRRVRSFNLDTNFQILNSSQVFDYSALLFVNQINDTYYRTNYTVYMNMGAGIFANNLDGFKYLIPNEDYSTFAYHGDTLGRIDISQNQIIIHNVTHKDPYYVNRRAINTDYVFQSTPIAFKNLNSKVAYFIETIENKSLVLYRFHNDTIFEQVGMIDLILDGQTFDTKLLHNLQSTKKNLFEISSSGKLISLDFNKGFKRVDSIQKLQIKRVVHFTDNIAAWLCIDSNSVLHVCIVDSNYNVIENNILPYRAGQISYAERNEKNQLFFISSTPGGYAYRCTYKICSDTLPDLNLADGEIVIVVDSSIVLPPIPIGYVEDMVYPNPVNDIVTVNIALTINAKLLLTDSAGNTYVPVLLNKTDKEFSLRTNQLSEGVYFIHIKDRGVRQSAKFVVKR